MKINVSFTVCFIGITNSNCHFFTVIDVDLLEFHPMCGAHTLVINNNTVAYRPK